MTLKKKPTTYRLTPELDKRIAEQAKKLGISKNAFVQIILSQQLGLENEDCLQQKQPGESGATGTEG